MTVTRVTATSDIGYRSEPSRFVTWFSPGPSLYIDWRPLRPH